MDILKAENLIKEYPKFKLDSISFNLEEGKITGFIGRNGAGKTTTLKSLLNFVHPDSGKIEFWGKSFNENELEIKQKTGFVSGGADFYPKKKIKIITDITKKFYDNWDNEKYKKMLAGFNIDEEKCPCELSQGMKVKYSLALALSHNAKLLILDEPTSGLDPVSRDELMDIFLNLCEENGNTILFSTHITSDLDKCADNIIYIKNGKLIEQGSLESFTSNYKLIEFENEVTETGLKEKLIGLKREKHGYSAIITSSDCKGFINIQTKNADLETIMIHFEKEQN